jgi:hypothetical protein
VRWKTCSFATSGWIAGTYWIAEAPVPIEATRLPSSSASWSQRAEWKTGPGKSSRPGISGIFGSVSGPMPATSTRALRVPSDVSSSQWSSRQVADSTAVFSLTWRRTPKSSATRRR